jgi:hypothetical protein
MGKKYRALPKVDRAFYTVRALSTVLGVSYETALGLVKRDAVPAFQLTGSRLYLVPRYWVADLLAQCVENAGPPTTPAGFEELMRAGVSEEALTAAVQAWASAQGAAGATSEPPADSASEGHDPAAMAGADTGPADALQRGSLEQH